MLDNYLLMHDNWDITKLNFVNDYLTYCRQCGAIQEKLHCQAIGLNHNFHIYVIYTLLLKFSFSVCAIDTSNVFR